MASKKTRVIRTDVAEQIVLDTVTAPFKRAILDLATYVGASADAGLLKILVDAISAEAGVVAGIVLGDPADLLEDGIRGLIQTARGLNRMKSRLRLRSLQQNNPRERFVKSTKMRIPRSFPEPG